MVTPDRGTVVVTGPTGGLARETTLVMARRPASQRPDLILVGRASEVDAQVQADLRVQDMNPHLMEVVR
jgi:short-subunit dehydrogenase